MYIIVIIRQDKIISNNGIKCISSLTSAQKKKKKVKPSLLKKKKYI